MKKVNVIINLLCFVSPLLAQDTLMQFSWPQLAQQDKLPEGEILPVDNDINVKPLKLQNTRNQPIIFHILTVDQPNLTQRYFALTGMIRYNQIQGIGHLGMYIYYSEEEKSLQRTFGTEGPMRQLAGSSDWRPFMLLIKRKGDPPQLPYKLKFEVFLPGTGTVYLSPIRLVQFADQVACDTFIKSLSHSSGVKNVWWTNRTAGWIGAIGGASIGLLGALIGILNGMGKGKLVVITALRLLLIFGCVSLGAGIFALIQSQPYAVYYPLLLPGVLCTILSLSLYRGIIRRFEQIELRKMQAMDTNTL